MPESWPRISVVTPTFERVDFLEETIRSVLDQDYPNLEYIIVDGGSQNPELLDLVRRYEGRLTWISEPDDGHADAITKGFTLATGEILAWLCSDDTYLPGALRIAGETFRQHPRADVIFGHSNVIDAKSRVIRNGRVVRWSRLSVLANGNIHQASVFWSRAIYERAGGNVGGAAGEFNTYSPDSDLYYRFVKAKARWVRVPATLSTFRHHDAHTSTLEADTVRDYWWRAARRTFPIATSKPVFPFVRLYTRLRRMVLLIGQGDGKYLVAKLRGAVYPS